MGTRQGEGLRGRAQAEWSLLDGGVIPPSVQGMSRLALVPFLLALAWAVPVQAQQAPLWRLVAQSDVISTGRLEFPTGPITPRSYVELPVLENRFLKGETGERQIIRWFSEPGPYAPSAAQLEIASGSSSIVFAARAGGSLYFAGNTPDAVQPAEATTVAAVETEIARQEEVLRRWRDDRSVDHYAEVRSIIHQIARLRTTSRAARRGVVSAQQAFFDQLIALGDNAVPAIIMQMDDNRPLAESRISLVNDFPGAFEGTRHYGPDLIVEALDAVLNDITGESFGNIYNGGSAEERTKAVRGWRIYLDHLRSIPVA